MKCKVVIKSSYNELQFDFCNEEEATSFAVLCRNHLIREIEEKDGKRKIEPASVKIVFDFDDSQEEK